MNAHDLIDAQKLGAAMRYMRLAAGHAKVEPFSKLLESELGLTVNRRTIHAVETGKNIPSIALFCAYELICLVDGVADPILADSLVNQVET